jgi:hypothetical protein
MPYPNATNAKPAQISVTDDDRTAFDAIQSRAALHDVRVLGPTIIYRAGLAWLASLDDEALVAVLESFSEKLTPAMIQERFALWCSQVNHRVCRNEVSLQSAWSVHGFFDNRTPLVQRWNADVGSFSHQSRFIHLSAMQDGRVLISGLEANARAMQLFPGALATLLSMDDEGAELAARAIVAWLMRSDKETEMMRADMRRHAAQPLAFTSISSRPSNTKQLRFAREALYHAVLGLSTGVGGIHERLEQAAVVLSGLSDVSVDLPDPTRNAFDNLWQQLASSAAIHFSVEEATKLAGCIFELYVMLGSAPFDRFPEGGAE